MKNIFRAFGEIMVELFWNINYFIESNLYNFGMLIEVGTPYIMWYIGISLYQERGYFGVGGELFLPLVLMIAANTLKKAANRKGKGNKLPVYKKRFTVEDEWGEVSIREQDIPEIILYLNDLENYIEKRGYSRWNRKK